jgi:hypothetical protein
MGNLLPRLAIVGIAPGNECTLNVSRDRVPVEVLGNLSAEWSAAGQHFRGRSFAPVPVRSMPARVGVDPRHHLPAVCGVWSSPGESRSRSESGRPGDRHTKEQDFGRGPRAERGRATRRACQPRLKRADVDPPGCSPSPVAPCLWSPWDSCEARGST